MAVLVKYAIVHLQSFVGVLDVEKGLERQKFAKHVPKLRIFAKLVFLIYNLVRFPLSSLLLCLFRLLTHCLLGLPSQLRDAVLSQTEGALTVPESEANREYFVSQQLAMISNGNDPWQTGETPNDKLLKVVRAVAAEREQDKVKLSQIAALTASGKRQLRYEIMFDSVNLYSDVYAKTAEDESDTAETTAKEQKNANEEEDEILPPPGMTIEQAKLAINLQTSPSGNSIYLLFLFYSFLLQTQLIHPPIQDLNHPSLLDHHPNGPSRNTNHPLPYSPQILHLLHY